MELTKIPNFIKLCQAVYKNHPEASYLHYLIENNHSLLLRYFIEESLDDFHPNLDYTEEQLSDYKMRYNVYNEMMEIINSQIYKDNEINTSSN